MQNKNLRFSIVIPCFNEEAYIAQALKSLKNQDYDGGFEVIVVDNNCTDNTAVIAKRLDARIITEPHTGVCWARHTGTKAAKGEIVISTDADTVFECDWLAKIDAKFKENPSIVAIGGPCSYIDGPTWSKVYPKLLFGFVYVLHKLTSYTLYMTATNIAFKKSAWTEYNTTLTQGGDEFDLLHKLRREGKVAFVRKPAVQTSSRRLSKGLIYSLFVSFAYYYLAAYYLNKLFGRRIINSAPVYRTENEKQISFISMTVTLIIILFGIGIGGISQRTFTVASNVIDNIGDKII